MRIGVGLILVFLSFSSQSFSAESWACTEGLTTRKLGPSLYEVCGVGNGSDEATARDKALDAAMAELKKVCAQDRDCAGRETSKTPKRTTCAPQPDGTFKCFRAFEVVILDRSAGQGGGSDVNFKIHKGVSKTELLSAFGQPNQVVDASNSFLIFSYVNRDFCLNGGRCSVTLQNDVITSFSDITPSRSDVLQSKTFWDWLMGR
jgi:hypothetical protein